MTRVPAGGECQAPGDFQFQDVGYNGIDDPKAAIEAQHASGGRGWARIEWTCPRTGQPCGGIMIGHPDKPPRKPSWQWDGNVEAPTLHPSINCNGPGGCGWHGYMVAGVMKEC